MNKSDSQKLKVGDKLKYTAAVLEFWKKANLPYKKYQVKVFQIIDIGSRGMLRTQIIENCPGEKVGGIGWFGEPDLSNFEIAEKIIKSHNHPLTGIFK